MHIDMSARALDFPIFSQFEKPDLLTMYMTQAWSDCSLLCLLADFTQIQYPIRQECISKSCQKLASQESCTLIGIVMAELNRKIWEGGLMAACCVNSPGLRHLVSIHLGFLCHLQAVRMHAAEPRVWKTGWASSQLSCLLKEKKECCLWLQSCLAWGQQLHLFSPTDLLTWPVAAALLQLALFSFLHD